MNTPNPLMPQGSLQQSKGKSNVRIAFFTILAIHVVLLCGLLMQGCKRNPAPEPEPTEPVVTNTVSDFEPMTNPPVDNSTTGLPVDPTAVPPPAFPTPAVTDVTATATSVAPVTAVPPTVSTTALPPIVTPEPTPAAPVEGQVHVIQKGETLSTVAKKYGVSVRAIEEANPNVNALRLQIGQKINVPAGTSTAAPSAATADTTDAAAGTVYTVKSGDALEKIARQHGTTVKAIKALNGLRTDRITVGQKLKIPSGNGSTNQ